MVAHTLVSQSQQYGHVFDFQVMVLLEGIQYPLLDRQGDFFTSTDPFGKGFFTSTAPFGRGFFTSL